ncbi:MAG: WG repeat-containing protein [Tannerella sp.]|jgi:hypothetical protein|nr:WG repeat-containing protein [Tannerella sp.]
MKRKDLRKVWTGLITVSLMCIASCHGLREQDGTDPIPAERNGKWGYINRAGKVVIPLKYDRATDFSGGEALVRLNGQSFFIDRTGRETGPRYDRIGEFSTDGVAIVRSDTKAVFVYRSGKEIGPWYENIGEFSADVYGAARVELGGIRLCG